MAESVDLFDIRTLPAGDEGMTEMVIFAHPHTRKVVQRFARPLQFVAYDPMNAAEVANRFLEVALELGARVSIPVPRRQISKEKRDALVARAMHVIRSLEDKGRARDVVARNVVDSILSSID